MDDRLSRLDVLETWLQNYSFAKVASQSVSQSMSQSMSQSKNPNVMTMTDYQSYTDPHHPSSIIHHPPSLINPHSSNIIHTARMRMIIDIYDRLDVSKSGYINLINIDHLLIKFNNEEIKFLGPILQRYKTSQGEGASSMVLSMDTFIDVMMLGIRDAVQCGVTLPFMSYYSSSQNQLLNSLNNDGIHNSALPLTSSRRKSQIYSDIMEERHQRFSFHPVINPTSEQLAHAVRSQGNTEKTTESSSQRPSFNASRAFFLYRERAMWGQRRDALHMKQQAEMLAQCTFKPDIRPSCHAHLTSTCHQRYQDPDDDHHHPPSSIVHQQSSRPVGYLKPKKRVNAPTTEDIEIQKHCSFRPLTDCEKGVSGGKGITSKFGKASEKAIPLHESRHSNVVSESGKTMTSSTPGYASLRRSGIHSSRLHPF